jgi:hypothetical protein
MNNELLQNYCRLTVWEGPLQVSLTGAKPIKFRVDGPAGFYGLSLYSIEHCKAEWRGDEVSSVWGF